MLRAGLSLSMNPECSNELLQVPALRSCYGSCNSLLTSARNRGLNLRLPAIPLRNIPRMAKEMAYPSKPLVGTWGKLLLEAQEFDTSLLFVQFAIAIFNVHLRWWRGLCREEFARRSSLGGYLGV